MNKETMSIKKILAILLVIGIIFLLFLGLVGSQHQDTDIDIYDSSPTTHTVTYKVDGFMTASLSYSNAQGGTEQISKAEMPWMTTLYDMQSGDFVYISAQNNDEYGGVTVEIYLDGVLVKSSESNGAYVIATASGRI